jgi:hypothetical protein
VISYCLIAEERKHGIVNALTENLTSGVHESHVMNEGTSAPVATSEPLKCSEDERVRNVLALLTRGEWWLAAEVAFDRGLRVLRSNVDANSPKLVKPCSNASGHRLLATADEAVYLIERSVQTLAIVTAEPLDRIAKAPFKWFDGEGLPGCDFPFHDR